MKIIEENVSLKDKNWFGTGGYATHYCQPTTEKDFSEALSFAQENNLKVTLLGKGANVIISDDGFNGLIITPKLQTITHEKEKNLITVGAGTSIQKCIDWCLDHNLIGLEEFSGIPGTIGGAVYINIHYFHFFISHFLTQAKVINKQTGEVKTVDNPWFQFGYDQSKLQKKEWFLLKATFALHQATDLETAYVKGRRDEIIRQRNARYPTSHTCGSFFRNFHPDELDDVVNAKQLPFVAYYLDKLGIKGELSHGDAIVSHQHSNMIVNRGNATSNDIIALARKMQVLVFDNFGLLPQAECQCIGFNSYPLYKQQLQSKTSFVSHVLSAVKPKEVKFL